MLKVVNYVAIAVSFCFISCATVTMVGSSYQPKSIDAPIDVFITQKPDVPYTEIAIIKCEDLTNKTTIGRIKKNARKLGADAIIITGAAGTSGYANANGFYSSSDSGYSAVAIKYK